MENADSSNIVNTEIAYLGYNGTLYNNTRTQGFNMYGGDGTVIRDSKIHNLWYGFYSDNVGYLLIENNTIYNNQAYGIDPHSGSHNLVIRDNNITNNYAGLVCSYLCYNITFENNQIHGNEDKGILLSRNVSNSIVRFNNISDSSIGISVSNSHDNQIYENIVTNSRVGLQLVHDVTYNHVINNTIEDTTDCGLTVRDNSQHNVIALNRVVNSGQRGICISEDAGRNSFYYNIVDSGPHFGTNYYLPSWLDGMILFR